MKTARCRGLALLCWVVFCVVGVFAYGESVVQRVDARVVRSDPENRVLFVRYSHPVTGETINTNFSVDEHTGFKRVKGLAKIKEGDLVTVDYRQENSGAVAVYVDVVPVDRQVVSPSELARSLTQLKGAAKKD